jgi:hypothetical protein
LHQSLKICWNRGRCLLGLVTSSLSVITGGKSREQSIGIRATVKDRDQNLRSQKSEISKKQRTEIGDQNHRGQSLRGQKSEVGDQQEPELEAKIDGIAEKD